MDVSVLSPAASLTMAHRGVGAFSSPREVATWPSGQYSGGHRRHGTRRPVPAAF
ncbi:MAG TPA: hypothetical protein VK586_26165 [Streptosporangiaceae bacterium]|nr:hypothetical protein [Streptosporangiaceae bacterium]